MPIVVPAAAYTTWLSGARERARELLATPLDGWRADPVSTWVNSVEHDDARCVEPTGNPAQGELF
jgi:putative SOS response-associated peptidase YedK